MLRDVHWEAVGLLMVFKAESGRNHPRNGQREPGAARWAASKKTEREQSVRQEIQEGMVS